MAEHFGEHLTIDGYGGDPALLNDPALVLSCLNNLPTETGMHQLAPAQLYEAADNAIKDPGGWSGFVVIAESHISIHTFPKRGFASIDFYTCRNEMDTQFIIEYFREKFAFKEMETNFLLRGLRYPPENL